MRRTQRSTTKTELWAINLHRYFGDWQRRSATVPDFKFPRLPKRGSSPDDPPEALNHRPDLEVDLSCKRTALEGMWRSLGEALPLPSPTYKANAAVALPASKLSYDVVAAALRQKDFFYQVSLPHYRLGAFRRRAVQR